MRIKSAWLSGLLFFLAGAAEAGCPSSWEVREWVPPKLLWAGRRVEIPLTIANTSQEAWSESQGDHLSYHWRHLDGSLWLRDGDRSQLPTKLFPGESVKLKLRLMAPREPGNYLLELAMVREQVCWYPVPKTGLFLVPVRVWPLQPLYAGSVFLGSLGLWLVARRWRGDRWLPNFFPVVWLGALLWSLARLFALAEKSEGAQGFDLVIISSACALIWPLLLISPRRRAPLAAVGGLLASFQAFADVLYMRFFGSVIPFAAWQGVGQLGDVWHSVRSLMKRDDLWFAVAAGSCLVFFFWPGNEANLARKDKRWLTFLMVFLLWTGAFPASAKIWRFVRAQYGMQVFSLQQRAQDFGLWGVHLFDALRTSKDFFRQDLDPQEKQKVVAFFSQRAAVGPVSGPNFGAVKGANLILIQVESLQNFVINLTVAGQEVTPFLNQLTRKALYFSWVFDQTNQGRSSDGEFITLNSQHALAEGAAVFRAARNRFLALPKLLQNQGYHTLSAHPFDRGFWNRALLHPRYGFQQSFFRRELGPGEVIGWGLADGVFFNKMLPILRQAPEPFFAFLITLGLHHPFDTFPPARKTLVLPDLGDKALENYLQAMHYFDESLAKFFAGLAQTGLLSRTVVALYGDHEAGFPCNSPLARLLGISFSPGRWVWLRRVPFFVATPKADLAGEIPEAGGHVDIAPTLLYLLGQKRPQSFVGSAILPGRGAAVPLGDDSGVDRLHIWSNPWNQCEDRASFAPLPVEACASLRAAVQKELWASRMAVMHDMLEELSP